MASALTPNMTKQPLKCIEIPLNKFTEEVIPHHQRVYEQYKATIQKLISVDNVEQLKREAKNKKRTIKQLRDLMYELDTLRTQVEDVDLDTFDIKTLSLRKIILNLINGYTDLEKVSDKIMNAQAQEEEINKENCNPFEGAGQIQIQDNINELRLKQQQEQLNRVESINKDVGELHEMYQQLNEMVENQGEHVTHVENTVNSTQENVQCGAKDIVKSSKLMAVAYPVTGAFLGGIIGGPIGLVAGLKVGGLAAVGCAIAGYGGGKYFKKIHSVDSIQDKEQVETTNTGLTDTSHKKDI